MAYPVVDCRGVQIRDEHATALRSLLKGESDAWGPFEQANSETEAIAYHATLYGAFIVAVGRKFSPKYSLAQIIHFVADLRTKSRQDADMVHPRVAEELIREALGEPTLKSMDLINGETAMNAEVAVLMALLNDAEFDEAELEEFVEDAAKFARDWVATRQRESSAG